MQRYDEGALWSGWPTFPSRTRMMSITATHSCLRFGYSSQPDSNTEFTHCNWSHLRQLLHAVRESHIDHEATQVTIQSRRTALGALVPEVTRQQDREPCPNTIPEMLEPGILLL